MTVLPILTMISDTLLVRPVAVPAPWYSVASGVLSIVVTVLLLGIAVALLGMLRAVKGVEHRLGGRMQGLTDELLPLARNLNQIAVQLSEVTAGVRGDLHRLSGTVAAVDDAVRDVIDDGQARLAALGTMLDAVQDEAGHAVASAAGLMRGVRVGTGSLFSDVTGRRRRRAGRARPDAHAPHDDARPLASLSDAEILARLAALEEAFAARAGDAEDEDDDDEPLPTVDAAGRAARRAGFFGTTAPESEDDEDEPEDEIDDDLDDDLDDDDEAYDPTDDVDFDDDQDDGDDDDDDGVGDDRDADDDEDDADAFEDDDEFSEPRTDEAENSGSDLPRIGGPRIRPHRGS